MKILVVDDARDMRIITKHLLTKLGHDIDTAVDGSDAWDKLLENDYHVVVSDWVMPIVDGLELCKKVRAHDFSHYVYFILLTGMSGKQNLISGIDAGADDFATKPANIEELEIRLRAASRILTLEHTLEEQNEALTIAHDTLQKELEAAADTQINLLPKPLKNEELKSAWFYKPAVFVGGDTFSYFPVASDLVVFFSLDISGHGVSSAMLSMSLQSSMALKRSLYEGPITRERAPDIPAIFARNVNRVLLENDSTHYLTMIFGIADLEEHKIHYVQAGHPHPIFIKNADKSVEFIENPGFPIGLFDGASYETQHIDFEPGDKFILYSDGISENDSAITKTAFDNDNLLSHVEKIKTLSADEMADEISKTWLTSEQMAALPDDISFLILERQ
ncbi:MAG: Serine phosphatase RsbU, regulator of sigma subunit [uncultured Thiotrichaceae bacterium]|uniref:Serine phosphatase RsbU, regulator of sigma subunit n=1 Tax=uncultured Thiotrichaceae bacterium TaxID=298394 RepID=A0A6S6TFG6_9GAMM|nr:MAG: Serine phosphatase RsbU, regulator of sigma subunit [uncultured Thiotrichaceae bacterium]